MKKLLILILFLSSVAQAQISPFAFGGSGVWALDFDGSTEYLSCTPALRLTGEYSLYDNFSDGNYDGWTVSSGAYSVVDSVPLSGGTKSLKCTTDGVIGIPCNQIYGSWEFDWYKTANSRSNFFFQNTIIGNIAQAGTGYYLSMMSTEYIILARATGGNGSTILSSATPYVSINTWHRLKITRNTNGQFHLYIKGGAFGSDYVLVSVTGGSGTNPVTDNTYTLSNYFVLDLDANDMIANIVCQQGEGSLDLNSYERIYHSNNRAFEDTTGFRWTTNGTHSIARNTNGVTGSNLIPDSASTFNTGGTGYWSASNGTASWESSDSSIKLVSNGGIGYISKSNLTAGASYKYSIKAKATTYTGQLGVFSGVPYPASHTLSSSWQTFTGSFYATTAITYISLWTSHAGDIYFDNIVLEKLESRTGYSGKLISTDVGDSTTNFVSLPAVNFDTLKQDVNSVYEKYTLEFWVKSKALSRVIVKVGNQVKTSDTISNIAFEKVVFNFQSNALVSNQPILLYLNQADTVYLDDVSLTKAYDVFTNQWVNSGSTGEKWSLSRSGNGFDYYVTSANNSSTRVLDNTNVVSAPSSKALTNLIWYLSGVLLNRVDSTKSIYNGTHHSSATALILGRISSTNLLYVGSYSTAGKWIGKIGHTQIVKFTDISQSNINSTTLTTAYNRGKLLSGEWTGGSPVEVAFYDWKGADITEILRDKSGTGNNLTGTNMDINDRVKVKSKFK